MNKKQTVLTIAGGVIARLIPHIANVAPVGAIALFSGYTTKHKWYWAIPLSIMFISDIFLGFHSTIWFVYASYILTSVLGRLYAHNPTLTRIATLSVISSVVFYLVTNFGVWVTGTMYTKNLQGLMECYLYAIPFFRATLLGDLVFNGALYAVYLKFVKSEHRINASF
jgi:hypothetical protein